MEVTVDQTIHNIRDGLSSEAHWFPPGTPQYIEITTSYFWSSSEQDPLCIFQPATPDDVKTILRFLARAPARLTFAVRAGTHIAPTGFNATTGLLIDMSLFQRIHYNKGIVEVGPGLLYPKVYTYLEERGQSVNGATSCDGVGVAGFNLGGGFGNRTNQYGLAMDTIQAIEVVLPTHPEPQIKTVNARDDPEIFRVLKGGGNNFGIVTKWFMTTYEYNGIYSAQLHFQERHIERVQRAICSYVKKELKHNPKSNVESKFEWITTTQGSTKPFASVYVDLFYDGKIPPRGLFDEFFQIPHAKETKLSTWHDLMDHLPKRRSERCE